jgi:hypothetical protein
MDKSGGIKIQVSKSVDIEMGRFGGHVQQDDEGSESDLIIMDTFGGRPGTQTMVRGNSPRKGSAL